jgi:hypothetical protein
VDPVVTGGLIGIGGSVAGALVADRLAAWRERRAAKARRRRAIFAVMSELIENVSVLDHALFREAWWPRGDEPRTVDWDRFAGDLVEELPWPVWHGLYATYGSLRSLIATRNERMPSPMPLRLRLRLRLHGDKDALPDFWMPGVWLDVRDNVVRQRQELWEATSTLREVADRFAHDADFRVPERAVPSGRPEAVEPPGH